jgi:Leucine-rich repeat (LRR) protein
MMLNAATYGGDINFYSVMLNQDKGDDVGKIALAFLPAIVIIFIAGCVQNQTERSTVIFSDPNLEAAIREAIDKPEGPINISDLEGPEILYLSPYDIADISPLSKCTNLKELYLVGNLRIPSPSTPNSDQNSSLTEIYFI